MSHICPFYADVQIYIIYYISRFTQLLTSCMSNFQATSVQVPVRSPSACEKMVLSFSSISPTDKPAQGPRDPSKGHKKSSAHSVPYPFFSLRSWPHGFPPLPRPKRRLWHGLVTYTVFIRWANNGLPETDPLLSWFQNVGLSSSLPFNSCKWD